MAQDSAEGARHRLEAAAHARTLARAGRLNAAQLLLALATFRHGALLLHVQVDQPAAGRADTGKGQKRERITI